VAVPCGDLGDVSQARDHHRSPGAYGRSVPELSFVIAAPATDRSVLHQGEGMVRAHGDRTHIREPGHGPGNWIGTADRMPGLSRVVVTPRPDTSICTARHGVAGASAGVHDARDPCPDWVRRGVGGTITQLSRIVVAPSPEGTVGTHVEGVTTARGHRTVTRLKDVCRFRHFAGRGASLPGPRANGRGLGDGERLGRRDLQPILGGFGAVSCVRDEGA